MVHIVDRKRPPSLGTALGSGISEGLKELLKNKLEAAQKARKQADLKSLIGMVQGREPEEESALQEETDEVPTQEVALKETVREEPADTRRQKILGVHQFDPKLASLMQAQEMAQSKEEASKFKETKELRKSILEQSSAARDSNTRLNRMLVLNKEGKLIGGLYNDLLKRFGIDFPSLKNASSQEFEKLTSDMMKNIKEIFGARVTNLDVSTFLKSIPTLSQTTEGRERVIRNLKLLNEGALLKSQGLKDIVKKNKGIPPYDLGERIEERISPRLDEISKEFVTPSTLTEETAFEKLPSASEYEGKIFKDTKSGKRYKSTGSGWKIMNKEEK